MSVKSQNPKVVSSNHDHPNNNKINVLTQNSGRFITDNLKNI